MCGIAGRFSPGTLPPAPEWRELADARLAHRGPDGKGSYVDDYCELVHRRLALVDLSPTGAQPMANEDGAILVVFNGEIYNHRDLRAQLVQRGHVFRGTSDTEVLVHGYETWGDAFVERLRGIFAFAIYDRPRRRILLARDRFGVKPLFYTNINGQYVFASEIKAIAALPEFRPSLDRQACFDFLGLGYVPEPATGFADVFALPKGCTLSVTPEGQRLTRYHEVVAQPDTSRTLDDSVDALEEAVLRAVASQSMADVPVGALLSGGIDSSLVVAAHKRAMGAAPTTLNVRFPDARFDETPRAHAVAAACGSRHVTVDASERPLSPEQIIALLRHFDQPFADTSCFPTFWVASAIREQGLVCALAGDGGDEAFGGYSRFWRANGLSRMMAAPRWMRQGAIAAGRSLSPVTRDWGRQIAKAAALAEAGRDDSAELLSGLHAYLSEDQKCELVTEDACAALLPCARHFDGYRPTGAGSLEELSRRMTERHFSVSLPGDMLRKVDMMSMLASIEVRVPMLDEDVVALGLTMPHRLKTDGRSGKLVLRALARRWLPEQIARQPKQGFGIPLDVMVPTEMYGVLRDLLCGPSTRTGAFMNGSLVDGWLTAFAAAKDKPHGGDVSRGGLYQRVFTLLSLELWLRDYGLVW